MKEIKVLIVDDREVFREGLARLLEEQQHIKVVSWCAGKQAIGMVEKVKPDLVLMDTDLSECDSIDVVRQVTESSPEVKIAMFSESVDQARLFASVEAGASGYLVKDLSVDNLVKSIDLISEGRVVISPLLSKKFVDEFTVLREEKRARGTEEESDLSERETEILRLVAEGYTNKEIAQKLCIAENTAKVHVKNILQKLELRNRQQAAAYAAEHGLVTGVGDGEDDHESGD
ncbi:MAG: response regulator transcription factor [Dehalococcoidia bacterium]|nr:response regulator transcription factor [Dehalococcoidia bacterium]